MKLARSAALVVALVVVGCGGGGGGGGGESGPTVAGALKVLNGPTSTAASVGARGPSGVRAAVSAGLPNGTYRLSPSKMTFAITGVGLVPAGSSGTDSGVKIQSLSACTATYDRSQGSLAVMTDCAVDVPTGSFAGIVLQYDPTYTVVMDDETVGIYSDPNAQGGLATTPPAGGAQPIQVTDQNQVTLPGQVVTFFATPLTIAAGSSPQLYVVFDPTHWMIATLNGTFATPRMSGNPPIVPAASAFGKAAFYTNIGTTMSYNWDTCHENSCESLLFLYGDATTPASVTWQDHDICSPMGGAPVVAFNGNGTMWGTCGLLGLDASQTLAWTSPAGFSSSTGAVTGYTGVYSMPERSTLGTTTDLQYKCTTTVPPPTSGTTYSSGAPVFTPDGTLSLTLLAD